MVCIDEKKQIQPLDRTAPIRPMRAGLPEKATHDYLRHGTTSLFAPLEVVTGKVTDACYHRTPTPSSWTFSSSWPSLSPGQPARGRRQLRHPQTHPKVKAWLSKNPRVTMHFTPTSGSWMNMVEIFFGIVTRQAIRRGTFTSVKQPISAIANFIDGWNDRCTPYIWTKPLTKSSTKRTVKQL